MRVESSLDSAGDVGLGAGPARVFEVASNGGEFIFSASFGCQWSNLRSRTGPQTRQHRVNLKQFQ